jgi:hypothetical protein
MHYNYYETLNNSDFYFEGSELFVQYIRSYPTYLLCSGCQGLFLRG